MTSVQSPPGMLNVFELFIAFKMRPATLRVSEEVNSIRSDYEADEYCTVFSMIDTPDLPGLEYLLKEKLYPIVVKLALIRISLYSNQQFQSFKIDPYPKKYLDEDSLRQDLFTFLAVHDCRDLLSSKYLKAYVFYDYAYHELPAEFWFYDKNWYRFLVDGCAQGNIPNIGDILGSVYFKKEEVNYLISNGFKGPCSKLNYSQNFIDLDTYSTPWLQVLAAVYEEHEKDKLAQVSKTSIESFISDYIKKHQLDISSSDIPFLAKFIRLAEQKEGKKYHAKRRLQNH